nr:zinc finger Y-chromosomal protein 1-like [Nomia melanderi]
MACGKPPGFCCTLCDYKSYFKGNLKRHLLYAPLFPIVRPRLHVCPRCGQMYSWASNLRKHLKMGCGMVTFETHFSCQYCPYRSRIEASFLKHLLSVHNINGVTDDPLGVLDAFHEETDIKEEGSRFLTDDFEDDEEEDRKNMNNAQSIRDEKQEEQSVDYKYTCLRCRKSYKRKGHLVEHQKIFCGKDKQECCPYCAFRTYKKSNLKKHITRMH